MTGMWKIFLNLIALFSMVFSGAALKAQEKAEDAAAAAEEAAHIQEMKESYIGISNGKQDIEFDDYKHFRFTANGEKLDVFVNEEDGRAIVVGKKGEEIVPVGIKILTPDGLNILKNDLISQAVGGLEEMIAAAEATMSASRAAIGEMNKSVDRTSLTSIDESMQKIAQDVFEKAKKDLKVKQPSTPAITFEVANGSLFLVENGKKTILIEKYTEMAEKVKPLGFKVVTAFEAQEKMQKAMEALGKLTIQEAGGSAADKPKEPAFDPDAVLKDLAKPE